MSLFRSFNLDGTGVDLTADPFPTAVATWRGDLERPASGTHFGFVYDGTADVNGMTLAAGMYFAVPGPLRVCGGQGLVVTREGYRGFFHVGGPVEETGRLRYIDGCTDSLLIPPVLLGDPCLNLLHIPPHTRQSAHTHPSIRVGLIVSGRGTCVTPHLNHNLRPGLAFVIPAGATHSFHTIGEALRVIAYHPDSDFGPTHECHPMVNRTILPTEKP